jgi:hypothetical protein
MGQFFARLSEDMADGPTEAALDDMLTVLAALAHASAPLTVEQLATALGWPTGRVTSALHDAERRPDITDPLALQHADPGAYTVTARPDRLTTAQRTALAGTPSRGTSMSVSRGGSS